ncbi:MAG: YggS family pyridoxal phosphate-dependent enzyme [Fidelibacterota bacterium]
MLTERLARIQATIATAQRRSGHTNPVEIIAVTKTHSAATIEDIYRAGLRTIGENRVQEAARKFSLLPALPGLIRRMIGHLQTNKINKSLSLFDTIDSIDSVALFRAIESRLPEDRPPMDVLLEVNTSGEAAKHGFDSSAEEDMLSCLTSDRLSVKGLMTVGPLTDDATKIRAAFCSLYTLREKLNTHLPPEKKLTELSMGMSNDYEIAVEEGATMIRLGTLLFGPRKPWPPTHV